LLCGYFRVCILDAVVTAHRTLPIGKLYLSAARKLLRLATVRDNVAGLRRGAKLVHRWWGASCRQWRPGPAGCFSTRHCSGTTPWLPARADSASAGRPRTDICWTATPPACLHRAGRPRRLSPPWCCRCCCCWRCYHGNRSWLRLVRRVA